MLIPRCIARMSPLQKVTPHDFARMKQLYHARNMVKCRRLVPRTAPSELGRPAIRAVICQTLSGARNGGCRPTPSLLPARRFWSGGRAITSSSRAMSRTFIDYTMLNRVFSFAVVDSNTHIHTHTPRTHTPTHSAYEIAREVIHFCRNWWRVPGF